MSKKWSELTSGSSAERQIGTISKPRNPKRLALPPDSASKLQKLDSERQKLESEKKQATTQATFIQSSDKPPVLANIEKSADEQAFDQYARLQKLDGGESGFSSAPQNFNDAAARHAKEYVEQVQQRKDTADSQEDAEFWLSSPDQEKLAIATKLLAQQDDKPSKLIAESAAQLGPIQKNSSQQYLSFMAWREWRNDTSQTPSHTPFSIPAAVAYANELLTSYAGKEVAKSPEVQALLRDATELIAREQLYTELAENIEILDSIFNSLDEIKAPESHPTPPAPPAPRLGTQQTPPAPPAPRQLTEQTATSATTDRVPALDTFPRDIQAVAYTRLSQFFADYVKLIDQGNVQIDRTDIYLPAMAAAANDFLEKASAAPAELSDLRMFGAASFLINTYLRHQAEIRASGSS